MPAKSNDASVQSLKRDLQQKTLRSLYFFCGEENYLKEYYLGQIRAQLLTGPAESFNHHRFNAENFTAEAFANAVEALPMMAEHTLVELSDIDPYKLPEADRERLIGVFSDLPDYCHIIFVYHTVAYKPDRRLRKLHAAIEKAAAVVTFEKQSERDLARWIAQHVRARGKEISFELCRYLILRTGGTMRALLSEIEKLCAYAQTQQITREQIDAVVEPVLDAYVFDMTDALVAGNYAAALETLRVLLQMQQEPIPLLGAIGSQFRRIYAAQLLLRARQGTPELMKLYQLSSYPAQKVMGYARRLTPQACKNALLCCAQTDYQMKTSYDRPERLLELLLLRLAQERAV